MLLRRDHALLDAALATLLDVSSTEIVIAQAFDELRMLFTAHVESEALVLRAALRSAQPPPFVAFLTAQVTAAHIAQERALEAMAGMRPGAPVWRAQARRLGELMAEHTDHEAASVLPALRDNLPPDLFDRLATRYATVRKRALELRPSAA